MRMTEGVYQKYSATVKALIYLVEGQLETVEECYGRVLQATASTLAADGFGSLSTTNPGDRALLPILIIARVEDNGHAYAILTAFEAVPQMEKRALISI